MPDLRHVPRKTTRSTDGTQRKVDRLAGPHCG